jgi:peptidoglycan/LPS O-acetylase OafA/YrhL
MSAVARFCRRGEVLRGVGPVSETIAKERTDEVAAAGPATRSSRLVSIDFLRGIAATAVVLHHVVNWRELPDSAVVRAVHTVLDPGYLGVPLFFVISGFCIHMRWARRFAKSGEQRLDFADFWKRRIRRLYPPYFVMLCLSMGLIAVAYALGREVALLTLYPDPKPAWMAFDFGLHVFMLHGLHPVFDRAGGNPPFWTLAREEYFYMMYFALLAWRKHFGLTSSAVAVFALGVVFTLALAPVIPAGPEWRAFLYSSAITLWIQWTLGMVAVEAFVGLYKLPRWCSSGWLVPVWAASAVAGDRMANSLAATLWGMTFFTLLNWCVRLESTGKWPRSRVVAALSGVGIYSYSLYLIHNPVRAVGKQLLGPLGNSSDPIVFLAVAALFAVASFAAAIVFFRVVERRFLNNAG